MEVKEEKVNLKNSHTLALRSPIPDEAEILLTHLETVFSESYKNMNHPADYFDNFSIDKEKEIIENFSKSKEKFMISAFFEGKIVGNLGVFGLEKEFLKHSARVGMGIEKSFHGVGLGKVLLKYATQISKDMGFHRLELTVRTHNEAGIKLYERSGFKKVGRLKDVAYIDGAYHDEYFYELILR